MPDNVINANSIGAFENRPDRFWSNQACHYDYKANLTGTRSPSQLYFPCFHSSLSLIDANIEAVARFSYSSFCFVNNYPITPN